MLRAKKENQQLKMSMFDTPSKERLMSLDNKKLDEARISQEKMTNDGNPY